MSRRELLDEYEATGSETTYLEAKRLCETALEKDPNDAQLLHEYGYLLESHARIQLREAAARYERAIELSPDWDKPRYQLIAVRAALLETDDVIDLYRRRLAASPDSVREYRYLANAYLLAHQPERAMEVVRAGLKLAPADSVLTYQEGEASAQSGRHDEALERWRRSLELDPDHIDGRYSAAFLLERVGRLDEAADEWRAIADWNRARGYVIQAEWPERELARITTKLAGR